MGKPNKDKQEPVENKDLELANALGLSEEDVTEHVEDETEEQVQASASVPKEETKPVQENKPEPKKIVPAKAETVFSDDGTPMFKRLEPTINSETPKKIRPQPATKLPDKRIATEPSANAALLTFPTDRWGITKDLKKAMTHLASRIAGDQNKKDLTDEVLKILVLHMNAKFKADQVYKQRLAERAAAQEEVEE